MGKTVKFTLEYAEQYFKKYGCKLLEDEYIGAHHKMIYICNCGNTSKISFSKFKQGKRCKKCGKKRASEKTKHLFEFVYNCFRDEGCILLEEEYINCKTKMSYECSCGNISEISFASFQQGHRCRKCGSISGHEKLSHTFEYIKGYFKEYGCEVLDEFYVNVHTKIKYKCFCGDIESINFNKFLMKKYKCCSKCTLEQNRGENRWNWIKDRKKLKEINNFKMRCRSLLRHSLVSVGKSKKGRTYDMLGYTYAELKNYVCNHSNWTRVKNDKWHLDHIFPLKAFVDYGIDDIKLINSFDNLQPLLVIENLNKNANYNKKEFENWLKKKKVKF